MRRDFGYFEEDQLGKPYDIRLLRRLFPFVRPYSLLFLLSIGLVTGITVLDLALPYLTKVAIDRYIVQDSRNGKPEEEQHQRFYSADMRKPNVEQVVRLYPKLFHVEGDQAKIRYDHFGQLKKEDLAYLREGDFAGVARVALIFLGVIIFHFAFSFAHVIIMERSKILLFKNLEFGIEFLFQLLNLFLEDLCRTGHSINTPGLDGQKKMTLILKELLAVHCRYLGLVGLCNVLEDHIHLFNDVSIGSRMIGIRKDRNDVRPCIA